MKSIEKNLTKKLNNLGVDGSIVYSWRKNKRFAYVPLNNEKVIHFGDSNAKTFFDGASDGTMKSYKARHSKIKNKDGELVYKIVGTPSWLSYNLLWT
jgi:hypothetical protein